MTTTTDSSQPRRQYQYIQGPERTRLTTTLKRKYTDGASIRDLADQHDLTYSTTRNLLLEGGVALRPARKPKKGR